jgi:signal peptidase
MTALLRHGRRTLHAVAVVGVALSLLVLLLVGLGPRTGRFQVLTVLTGSMTPSAPAGSLAVIAPKAREDLRVGDVLTYAIPVGDHHVVTHRVVEVRDMPDSTIVRTKGDSNDAVDPWSAELTAPEVWTERFAVPHAGAAIVALRSRWVHHLGQLAPFLLAIAAVHAIWRRHAPSDALAS